MSEQQKSYEELINEKSVVEKIAEFFKTYKVALFIGIGFICFFGIILIMHVTKLSSSRSLDTITNSLGASDILIAVLSFITVVMFIINIYFYCLFIRHKELPHKTKVSRALVTIISLIIALFILLLDKKNIWIVLLLTLLCIINHCISLTYKEKWDMPYYLKNIVGLQVIGTIIAVFQAFIAWDQLKSAWEAVTSDDISKLQQTLSEFNNHVDNYVIVDIPDSLMNDEVKQARYFQKQIYTYSLAMVNQDWSRDRLVLNNCKNTDDVKSMIIDILNNISRRKDLIIPKRMLIDNLIDKSSEIAEYYRYSNDNMFFLTMLNRETMDSILSISNSFTKELEIINNRLDSVCQILESGIQNESTPKSRVAFEEDRKIILKEILPILDEINLLFEKNLHRQMIICKYFDEMCLDYISILNLIQLKYAYNIDPYKPNKYSVSR